MADPSGGPSADSPGTLIVVTVATADAPPAGPVLHEKSDSMHAAIPPPSPQARSKNKFGALRRFFCCRSSTILQEPLNSKSNRNVEEHSRASSIALPPGTSGSVTQQIVLAPEEKVQQQINTSVAVTVVAQAGGDEVAQHEAARLTGEVAADY